MVKGGRIFGSLGRNKPKVKKSVNQRFGTAEADIPSVNKFTSVCSSDTFKKLLKQCFAQLEESAVA